MEQAEAVADYLEELLEGDSRRDKRVQFSGLPGNPRITVSYYDFDGAAPFKLLIRTTKLKYIPFGEESDSVPLQNCCADCQEGKSQRQS